MGKALVDGLYEHVINEGLARELARLEPTRGRELRDLDEADAHVVLARYLTAEIERALDAVPAAERLATQVEITNRLLGQLADLVSDAGPGLEEARVESPGRQLRALFRAAAPRRPSTPLASSTLLTRNQAEPNLGAEIAAEIASADRVSVLVAFITVGGIRALRGALDSLARRGGSTSLRVLTTVFTGTTEPQALEWLAKLPGSEVRVSYDVRRTRLHAKAWLFERDTGLHTAYVGSANLTSTALGTGQEWMVKVCAADLPHVVEKFRGTFESLWNDREFEPFRADSEQDRQKLRAALGGQRHATNERQALFTLRPFPFQEEILDRLDTERLVHNRRRNLVVAATGTGKTVIAAFDYKRQADRAGLAPRLLFLAHRKEILEQARATFRQVMRDGAFGELLVGGFEPTRWEHVFASIQSVSSQNLIQRFGADHFRYVVVDECHHAPAASYQAVVPNLRPDLLLGLTATPERTDGKSLLGDFDGHIAAELRIWHALGRQLLVPFEYYGVADGTDLTKLSWSRTGYDLGELSGVYTGNDKRADLIVEQLRLRVADPKRVRGLAFCVSVEHAEYMARAFATRGLASLAVHGKTADEIRDAAPGRLRNGEINILCTCDLYNEGVDLPFVDTLLFLRPTASATLFIQQLGRGLRHDTGKSSCLVLDFIGQQRGEFRFDAIYAALTGVSRSELTKAAEAGFPFLPSGCVLQLDAVAREQVLDSLRSHLRKRARLVDDIVDLAKRAGTPPTLAEFLDATGRDLEDIYVGDDSWTALRNRAQGASSTDDDTLDLCRRLGWLTHTDEPARLRAWRRALGGANDPRPPADTRRLVMLGSQLQARGAIQAAEEVVTYLGAKAEVGAELNELCDVLENRVALPEDTYPVPEWPLALHRHYTRREIVAAVGHVQPGQKGKIPQGGLLKLDAVKTELLFITLDKSGSSFSPSTRYRDYAISPTLFHWETQTIASVTRPSGRRYIESPGNGWTFHLFVRARPQGAFAFVGSARYVSHERDRPIAITWKLEHELPALLYQRFASLTQG